MRGDPLQQDIRRHYDALCAAYFTFWGDHLHHGWFEGDEPASIAQEKLVRRLAGRARIPRGARVLDVGCGIGGSARWLARRLGCSVLGLTLSAVQVDVARRRARAAGLEERARFEVHDAARLDLAPESFDVVWVVECSEHLEDKARFVAECGRLLRPGGVLALASWLAADPPQDERRRRLVEAVCRGMLCPSLASRDEVVGWMRASELDPVVAEDVTARVERTWALCCEIVRRPAVRALIRFSRPSVGRFARTFPVMREAYAARALAYGLFAAWKPGEPRARAPRHRL
jgi:tocopherol O-methyltransferase